MLLVLAPEVHLFHRAPNFEFLGRVGFGARTDELEIMHHVLEDLARALLATGQPQPVFLGDFGFRSPHQEFGRRRADSG